MFRRSSFLLAMVLAACGGDDAVVGSDAGEGRDGGAGNLDPDSNTQILSVTPTELQAAGGETITIAGVELPSDAEVFSARSARLVWPQRLGGSAHVRHARRLKSGCGAGPLEPP